MRYLRIFGENRISVLKEGQVKIKRRHVILPSLILIFLGLALSINSNLNEISANSNGNLREAAPDSDSWMYEIIEPDSSIDPNNIYTFECEIRVKRPEALTTVCADFGWAVWDLKWGKWDALGGYGEGIYRVNDCEPSCAEGTITATQVDVVLTDLTFDGTRYYFNTAKIRFKDKSYDEDVYEFVWDIASFYRESPDMRSPNIYED